ncbi:E3 ubiquitin-protein ligase HOS1 isoform X1 [Cannabis sativa]|uniref:E3 ubiquitin-protein ligase HOS1 isoform X1 n=2 Tax=Cannabis sativa TaxID=3483 RepID=UPI0029CA9E58|nr:E3 ubiquitin-protein ligase HOS1 isoform X1 [Cannabis sativa]
MEMRNNGPAEPSSYVGGSTATPCGSHLRQPNYSRQAVQEALEHLASIDLIELCNEAKVERCRATRDLRSCGRCVESALNSCGHASLCTECSQRCDLCPVCRIPIGKEKNGVSLRPRLYYECIDAGLISKRYDDRFQEKEEGEEQITADVLHLYLLFDVALENNLVSLICHYVTDVCMDESAVSSNPVIAFLLDEVVVKDWCKRTYGNIIKELQGIYILDAAEMEVRLSTLKYSAQLAGISNVLEVLESSFRNSLAAQLNDLHLLQESISKTKQHLEIMIWCIRHKFLENVESRYANTNSWRNRVRERKLAAIKRSWPDAINNSEEFVRQEGSLFIEDALTNLEKEQGDAQDMGEELKVALQKDGISLVFRSKVEGLVGCYPFESLRAAIDILFLGGSSDMVVAKQAIFLYYLYDRHWTMPNDKWRRIVEDFAASFGITRILLLESLIFYLLDDFTDEAMQEACHLLPEISGPSTHPKIAQVLLERGNPDAALMVLRWSGQDGVSRFVSLSEAVTAVRVRVECGLFTEAFLHQRMLCTKVRENGVFADAHDDSKGEHKSWKDWVEILVAEICYLCIRRNMVDRMIELPWNSDEEKHLHKCLLDYAIGDPSSNVGSLLVVFYIQRYRYSEAYQVDLRLKSLEQEFIAKNSVSEEVLSRMRSVCGWREGLVEKCMALLPEVQRQQVMTGKLPEIAGNTGDEVEMPAKSDFPSTKAGSLLIPALNDSPVALWTDHTSARKPSLFETPLKRDGSFDNYHSKLDGASLFQNSEMGLQPQVSIGKNFKFQVGDKSILRVKPLSTSPSKDVNKTPSRVLLNSNFRDNKSSLLSPEMKTKSVPNPFLNESPYSGSSTANPIITPSSNRGLFRDFSHDLQPSVSSRRVHPERDDTPLKTTSSDDIMDVSWSHGHKDLAAENLAVNGGPRWRSDETSDEEANPSPQRAVKSSHCATPMTGVRRSKRLAKR